MTSDSSSPSSVEANAEAGSDLFSGKAISDSDSEISIMAMPRHIELPVFSDTDINLWLRRVELAFRNHTNITDDQKYSIICRTLPADVAGELHDIIIEDPVVQEGGKTRYEILVDALRQEYSLSSEKKLIKEMSLKLGTKNRQDF